MKAKTTENPWITKALQSPLRRNKSFMNVLKKRTSQNEQKFKNYKKLFETIKKKAKKIYYPNKLLKCTGDIKKNMECYDYERYNWKIKNKIDKSST